MQDILPMFRDYARLDLQRMNRGLSVPELERWARLKRILDEKFKGPESEQQDRRSSKRVPTRLRCAYASAAELRRASVTQIATGGVFVATSSPLPVGTKLTLRMHIEDSDTRIDVDGVVVSINVSTDRDRDARGMGIRFSMASAKAVEQISQLYATEAQRACERDESPETE